MAERFPEDYLPQPRRCERCGASVLSARWYGGNGGDVIVNAEPVQVVRFLGRELSGWVYAATATDTAKRNAAAMVSFDTAYTIHVCPASAATDDDEVHRTVETIWNAADRYRLAWLSARRRATQPPTKET